MRWVGFISNHFVKWYKAMENGETTDIKSIKICEVNGVYFNSLGEVIKPWKKEEGGGGWNWKKNHFFMHSKSVVEVEHLDLLVQLYFTAFT